MVNHIFNFILADAVGTKHYGKLSVRLHAQATLGTRQVSSLGGARQERNTLIFPAFTGIARTRSGNSGPARRLSGVNIFQRITRGIDHEVSGSVIRAEVLPAVSVRITQNVRVHGVGSLDTLNVYRVNLITVKEVARNVQTHGVADFIQLLRGQVRQERGIVHAVELATVTAPLRHARERGQRVATVTDQMGARRGARFAYLTVGCADESSFSVAALAN